MHEDIYQTEIAHLLGIHKSGVSHFVAKMRSLNLIAEDGIEYQYRGKKCTISNRNLIRGHIKYYTFPQEVEDYLQFLDLQKATDIDWPFDIHHSGLYYPIQNPPKNLFLNETPPHPAVTHIKCWHPRGSTYHLFEVVISPSVKVRVKYHGSSLKAWRTRDSRRIAGITAGEIKKKRDADIDKGVRAFVQYQKEHRRKIILGPPESRGKDHHGLTIIDDKRPNATTLNQLKGCWIDKSPQQIGLPGYEIETDKLEYAENINRLLNQAAKVPELENKIEELNLQIYRMEKRLQKSERIYNENAHVARNLNK